MRTFLDSASLEAKHAFIRDANYRYTIENDSAVFELIHDLLDSLGLKDEATRMFEL